MSEPFPECEKLARADDKRRAIENFLEFLGDEGLAVCTFNPSEFTDGGHWPLRESHHDLVMRYLEIDTVKLEEERRAIIDHAKNFQHGKLET